MKQFMWLTAAAFSLTLGDAMAWSNHTFAAYRAFEKMPEIALAAPITAEPLDAFLKSQEQAIERLLLSQDKWAKENLEVYPPLPAALVFKANTSLTQEARRTAFLQALRVAPNSKLALYFQPDPWGPKSDPATLLAHAAVDTLPEQPEATQRFVALQAGEKIAPLAVIASAADEPDYGMDINLWADSPSKWGQDYNLGALPFGNPALYYSTQAPFHMGFFHEDRIIYMAAPFIKKTFPLLRVHQYSTLAALAFRTGHAYWGWRFAGLALHYTQDLTQPYHANLSPGNASIKLIGINLLAMAGLPRWKDDMIVLLSNRHLALEKYQNQLMTQAALNRKETVIEKSLQNTDKDASYPIWSEHYVRDVVSRQSHAYGNKLTRILLDTMPSAYVSDPKFDFGVNEHSIDLARELGQEDPVKRAELDSTVAELLGNFGAHSRNLVRGVLKAGANP